MKFYRQLMAHLTKYRNVMKPDLDMVTQCDVMVEVVPMLVRPLLVVGLHWYRMNFANSTLVIL